MKKLIQKYFQVDAIQWMTHPPVSYPVCDSVRVICCDPHFGALETTHIPDREERERVKRMLDRPHLRVCYGAQPSLSGEGLDPNHPKEAQRGKAEGVLVGAVDEVTYIGTKGIAFLAGKWQPDSREQAYSQLLKTTRAVCDCAVQKGMMVELGVLDYDIDEAALTRPVPLATRFVADMGMAYHSSGLIADLSHSPTTYGMSRRVVRTLRLYIAHLHIGNIVVKEGCGVCGDQHPRSGSPESANDTEQLAEFFRVLKEGGFFYEEEPYVLSLEVKPWGDRGRETVLANTKYVTDRMWAMVED